MLVEENEQKRFNRAFICSPPDEVYSKNTSCVCFPVKCGLISVSVFTMILWSFLLILEIADFYNDYFEWWYVAGMIAIYSPLFVSVCIFMVYLSSTIESQKSDLTWLILGSWIAIGVLTAGFIWLVIYICFLYKYDFVYTGFEHYNRSNSRYIKQPKL
mgnify:CR=1 FL=1